MLTLRRWPGRDRKAGAAMQKERFLTLVVTEVTGEKEKAPAAEGGYDWGKDMPH